MKITATRIPDGSHELRVWLGEVGDSGDSGAPIDTVGNLHRVDADTCDLGLVHGVLTDDVNLAIGIKAIELGYRHMYFHRTAGGKASRWAVLTQTRDGMDYYHVDLLAQLDKYKRSFA